MDKIKKLEQRQQMLKQMLIETCEELKTERKAKYQNKFINFTHCGEQRVMKVVEINDTAFYLSTGGNNGNWYPFEQMKDIQIIELPASTP